MRTVQSLRQLHEAGETVASIRERLTYHDTQHTQAAVSSRLAEVWTHDKNVLLQELAIIQGLVGGE